MGSERGKAGDIFEGIWEGGSIPREVCMFFFWWDDDSERDVEF